MATKRRRGHHEGSVYKRSSDGKWVGSVHLGWEGGKRKRKVVYGKTRAEVNQKVTRILVEQQQGLPIATKSPTVARFLDDWLELSVKQQRSRSTYATYRTLIDNHITPAIGKHPLPNLTQQHVQEMLNSLTVSAKTARMVRATLRTALNHAMRWDLVGRNVATLTESPKGEAFEGYAMSPDQVRDVMEAVKGSDLEAMYAIALSVGLRQSELLGLRWADVDRDAGTISVRWQLQPKSHPPAFVELKTKSSRRTITLPGPVMRILTAHYRAQLERRLQAGPSWQALDLVFAGSTGEPYTPYLVRSDWERVKAAAGIPAHVRFHDMRHTAITILAGRGVLPATLKGIAGHATIKTTMEFYTHLVPENVRDSIDLVSDLYGDQEATM